MLQTHTRQRGLLHGENVPVLIRPSSLQLPWEVKQHGDCPSAFRIYFTRAPFSPNACTPVHFTWEWLVVTGMPCHARGAFGSRLAASAREQRKVTQPHSPLPPPRAGPGLCSLDTRGCGTQSGMHQVSDDHDKLLGNPHQ